MKFDHFDFIAPLYHRVGVYSNFETMMACADLPTTGRLLDAGGGTGRVANALRDHAKQIVVADASLGMLRYASAVAGIQSAVALSERLPFPNESFDRVIMVDALHHVFHQEKTARELFRMLKPRGKIVIEEPDISIFGVKLIALAEKLLLMRSRFLSPDQIAQLFEAGQTSIHRKDSTAWVVAYRMK
jgi:demethylmenaquinone methyltransferase/2-methoxy-6-polyprenyl-1,4-benzoquinol methylase